MEFRILGSLEVLADGRPVPLGGARQRAVLAILLLHRGEVVSVDRIVDELWGERPPDTATKTVQVYVSRLRKALGEGALVTRGGGYALEVDADQVDADRFERLAAEGREALDARRCPRAPRRPCARRSSSGAARRWPTSPTSRSPRTRSPGSRSCGWSRSRTASRPTWRSAATPRWSPSSRPWSREHPTRERLRGQLMLALYRSGRQAEALESYQDARRALDEELGLEPGPELQQLEQRDPRARIRRSTPRRASGPAARLAAAPRRRAGGVRRRPAARRGRGGDPRGRRRGDSSARRGQLAGRDRPGVESRRRRPCRPASARPTSPRTPSTSGSQTAATTP